MNKDLEMYDLVVHRHYKFEEAELIVDIAIQEGISINDAEDLYIESNKVSNRS